MKKFWRIQIYFFIILSVWIPFAYLLAKYLVVEKPLEKADAILILGGSATYIERTREATKAFKKGIALKILLTNDGLQGGWNQKEQRNPYFAENARWELIRQGIPEEVIEILPTTPVEGTNGEAIQLAEVAVERKLKSLLIVTSAYHSRRALWTFERTMAKNNVLLEIGIKSPPTGQQTPRPSIWWLSSSGWEMVGMEYVKAVYYWLIY